MNKFFEGLKKGLEYAIKFEKGKKILKTHLVELPEPPKKYIAKDSQNVRNIDESSPAVAAF